MTGKKITLIKELDSSTKNEIAKASAIGLAFFNLTSEKTTKPSTKEDLFISSGVASLSVEANKASAVAEAALMLV